MLPRPALRFAATAAAIICVVTAHAIATQTALPPKSQEQVQRLLTLLAAVGEEYREGVRDGAVVRPIEFEEAKTFVEDAQRRFQDVAGALPEGGKDLPALFAQVASAVQERAPVDTVVAKLAELRQRVSALTGVDEQVYPPAQPSAARGQELFNEYCVTCHGTRGDGKGPSAAGLNPPPANFTDPQFIHGETPYDFYHVVSLGKTNTAMPAWDGVLSVQDRWDLLSYLWTLSPGSSGVAEGQGVYLAHCANCHCTAGDGHAPFTAVLVKAAPDLSTPQALARKTDADLFAAVTDGIAGTPMPSFARTLRDDERWKAVAFMRVLSLGGPQAPGANTPNGGADPKRFSGLLRLLGQSYAQAWTGTQLTSPVNYDEAAGLLPQLSAAADALAARVEPQSADVAASIRRQAAAIVAQVQAHAAPGDVSRSVETLASLVDSQAMPPASQLATAAAAPEPNDPELILNESGKLLDAAVSAYARGDAQAAGTAADAYLQFEPLEPRLGGADAALKGSIEERFLRVRQLMRVAGNDAEIRSLAAAIHDDFAAARAALQPHASPYALFVESATIILREGFEIVLVIGALVAYVVKTRNPAMQRSVYVGTAVGVAASLATAFVMGELLRLHPAASDLLEGATMLLAAVVLFWVSYWLVSKSEAAKWQRYIRGKVETAASNGRGIALAGAAFLAVYREGFETVLFYQALYASAPTAAMTITIGFVAGSIALLIVYVLLRRFEVRIPMQQFFFVTGLFLYAMAAIFAGQGIHELQEAGIVAMTPVAWLPALPLLGVYPSLQSLAVQAVFVTLFVYASAVTMRRARAAGAPARDADTALALQALHTAIEQLRHEIQALRLTQPTAATAMLGERVEGLLQQVEDTAGQVRVKAGVNGRTNGGSRGGH